MGTRGPGLGNSWPNRQRGRIGIPLPCLPSSCASQDKQREVASWGLQGLGGSQASSGAVAVMLETAWVWGGPTAISLSSRQGLLGIQLFRE